MSSRNLIFVNRYTNPPNYLSDKTNLCLTVIFDLAT